MVTRTLLVAVALLALTGCVSGGTAAHAPVVPVERGMTVTQVVANWGNPWNMAVDQSAGGAVTILQYCRWRDGGYQGLCGRGSRPVYLRFVNDVLIGWTEF